MEYPYPIKDWREPDQYKNIKSFAWEFLRRNANYQRDYEETKHEREEALSSDLFGKYGLGGPLFYPPIYDEGEYVAWDLGRSVGIMTWVSQEYSDSPSMAARSPTEIVVRYDIADFEKFKLQLKSAEEF